MNDVDKLSRKTHKINLINDLTHILPQIVFLSLRLTINKRIYMKSVVLTLTFLFTSFLQAQVSVVDAPVNHLFIPTGYDNNDNIELVVSGFYPNTCFSSHRNEVSVVGDTVYVKVTALVRETIFSSCDKVSVPFHEVINVGNLQGGDYKIIVNNNSRNQISEKLFVDEAASRNTDDHVYAIVEYIDLGFTLGQAGYVNLMAKTPSDCYEFDRVEYISNKKDTISILPILKKVKENCSKKGTYFTIPLKYTPQDFSSSQILLFSRTLQGKSVYSIVQM